MSPIWASTSNFCSVESIETTTKSINSQTLNAADTESTQKNLSKMRSYLKRCENAFNNINLSVKRSSTTSASAANNGIRTRQTTSLWYIDEVGMESNESRIDFNCMENDSNQPRNMEQATYSIPEGHTNKSDDEYNNDHFKNIECVQPTLVLVSMSAAVTLLYVCTSQKKNNINLKEYAVEWKISIHSKI